MTSDVNITSALNAQQKTTGATTKLAEDFTQFLTLLTTQLKNQDPLSPMDSTEFTNQLVNFTGVEQQINTNQKLDNLVALGLSNAFSYSLNYVGKDISYLSSEANFDGSTPVNVSYAVTEGSPVSTKINILDEKGHIILTKDLTNTTGVSEFVWDGKNTDGIVVDSGTYTMQVVAFDAGNNSLDTNTVVTGHVSGIETQNGNTLLIVGERAVAIGSVINVKEPINSTQNTTA